MSLPRAAELDRFCCAEGLVAERAEAAALAALDGGGDHSDGGAPPADDEAFAGPGAPLARRISLAAQWQPWRMEWQGGSWVLLPACSTVSAPVCMHARLCTVKGAVVEGRGNVYENVFFAAFLGVTRILR